MKMIIEICRSILYWLDFHYNFPVLSYVGLPNSNICILLDSISSGICTYTRENKSYLHLCALLHFMPQHSACIFSFRLRPTLYILLIVNYS